MMKKHFTNNLTKECDKAGISKLPARDIMNRNCHTVRRDCTIKRALLNLVNFGVSGLPVLDNEERVIGIITEHDLLIQAASEDHNSQIKYTSTVMSVKTQTLLKDVLKVLYVNKLKRVPVVDKDNRIQGIISRQDILKALFHAEENNSQMAA